MAAVCSSLRIKMRNNPGFAGVQDSAFSPDLTLRAADCDAETLSDLTVPFAPAKSRGLAGVRRS
jgi:hypothetical protein